VRLSTAVDVAAALASEFDRLGRDLEDDSSAALDRHRSPGRIVSGFVTLSLSQSRTSIIRTDTGATLRPRGNGRVAGDKSSLLPLAL
jgi:hypothetical protein